MSEPTTMAPSAAKRSAEAKPIPDAAPVTYATLPSRRPMCCSFVPSANIRRMHEVAGVDGCRGGWVVVTTPVGSGASTVERVERLDAVDRASAGGRHRRGRHRHADRSTGAHAASVGRRVARAPRRPEVIALPHTAARRTRRRRLSRCAGPGARRDRCGTVETSVESRRQDTRARRAAQSRAATACE